MSDRTAPRTTSAATADPDKYQQMLALADLFDATGSQMRARARLGAEILADEDVAESAALSPATHAQAEDDIRYATTGKQGLLTRSVELDADALVVRATVLTYRWIDELQAAAYKTLGSIAGRAIGYLAPEVALGGAIVSAGLIETDVLDREGVAAYLSELAENNPELMDHLAGGGGLLEGLQMRSMLTTGVLASENAVHAARGGLRSIGVEAFPVDAVSALRDAAGVLLEPAPEPPGHTADQSTTAPRCVEDLMTNLVNADRRISVQRIGAGRYIAYLPGARSAEGERLRLVGADTTTYVQQVVRAIEAAVDGEDAARVMLVGSATGGTAAAEIAAAVRSERFVVDQVVTAGAPSAQVPLIPPGTRVLSLEERTDPVALLGSLINARVANRVTVVFNGSGSAGEQVYVAGGRAADRADHPELRAEIRRIHDLGFLAG